MIVRFFLDGIEINPPNNWQELAIELNYDKDNSRSQSSSVTEWEFGVGDQILPDGNRMLLKHKEDGLTKGVGVFEGLPFMIQIDDEKGTVYTLPESYVDAGTAIYDHDLITAKTTEQGSLDWLNERADSFTFEYLDSKNLIPSSYYVAIPYCISKKQNAYEIIIAAITIYVIIDKIYDQITIIGEKVTSAANPFMATNTFSIIVRIIYIIALFISLIGLLIRLYNTLVQPVKYHYGMYVKDLLEIGCGYLGVKFKSSIFEKSPWDKLCLLPEKYSLQEQGGLLQGLMGSTKTSPNEHKGYYKGTFGDLLRSMKLMFNARLVMDGTTLYFEKYNYKFTNGVYKIPNLYDSKYRFELNTDEIKGTYLISFQTDTGDRNTIQHYKGTSVQITTVPKAVTNAKMVTLRGIEEVRIPFALAKRKESLTAIESILSVFLKGIGLIINIIVTILNLIIKLLNLIIKVINALIKALKFIGLRLKFQIPLIPEIKLVSFSNLIENRKGMLIMEGDFVGVAKLLIIGNTGNPRNNKILDENFSRLTALNLWEEFHYYNSAIPYKDSQGKQAYIYNLEGNDGEPSFTFSDYEQVLGSNAVQNEAGEDGELLSLKWNPSTQTASGKYKIFKQYTNNLTQTINEPDGR